MREGGRSAEGKQGAVVMFRGPANSYGSILVLGVRKTDLPIKGSWDQREPLSSARIVRRFLDLELTEEKGKRGMGHRLR